VAAAVAELSAANPSIRLERVIDNSARSRRTSTLPWSCSGTVPCWRSSGLGVPAGCAGDLRERRSLALR
jgi:hypothetical protein